MKYKTIIWDWNGTLLDDAPVSIMAVNHIFRGMGVREITEDEYKEALDTPISKFYDRFLAGVEYDPDELSGKFYGFLAAHSDTVLLHRGAEEALKKAHDAGIKQYILSAAWNDDIIPELERFGVKDYIDGVWGASDREIGSKLERGAGMAEKYRIEGASCVLIGDTYHDFECAKAIGADCFLLTCGHQDKGRITRSGAEIFETFEDASRRLFEDRA